MLAIKRWWLGPVILVLTEISLAAKDCSTWFQSRPGPANSSYCECGSSLNGVIQCDNETEEVSISIQYCMTCSNISGKQQLVVGFTNSVFQRSSSGVYTRLPDNVSEVNDFMCTSSNRQGLLCGECVSGYGYAVNSYNNECAKCDTAYALGMFLLCAILPMTISAFLILLLRLNIPSGFLLGYICFCQSILVTRNIYTILYYRMIDSMNPFQQFFLKLSMTLAGLPRYFVAAYFLTKPTCMHHSISGLQAVFVEYIFIVYPLFLLLGSWLFIELHGRNFRPFVFISKPFTRCVAKLRNKWSVSDSIIHAYATFYFLSVIQLVFLSYKILYSLKVYDINFNVIRTVMVYEPTMEWFSPRHLLYAIPAILLLLFLGALPTLLLCTQSTRLLRRCFRFRPHAQLIINTFVDTFTGCYKDGCNNTYDLRFLSSFPIIVAFGLFFCFPSMKYHSEAYVHLCLTLVLIIIGLMYSFARPFKSLYMNYSLSYHCSTLAICLLISILIQGNVTSMSRQSLSGLFTFFIFLPHVVAFMSILYYCLKRISYVKKAVETASGKFRFYFNGFTDNEMAPILPDRLENSAAYCTLSS